MPTETTPTKTPRLDTRDLENKVKEMYRDVALHPDGEFHFEMGRAMAERLGYDASLLDRIPAAAIQSFAGVGHFFHLAALRPGESVVDLGSGSGTDTCVAAILVGPTGRVVGVDMTDAQLAKAARLANEHGLSWVRYESAYIEETSLEAASADCVISNGVINLAPDKRKVFAEAARLLRPGGRLAISDIVSEKTLPESVQCSATLWAACIGGARQEDDYRTDIESAGLRVETWEQNREYRFISDRATGAATKFGVKSVSILARKA